MANVNAELTGTVWQLCCAVGDTVAEGDELILLESMKMEIPVVAPAAGTVATIEVAEGDTVARGQLLLTLG